MTTGKTIALTRQTTVGKIMSLLFNMLSRLVITFLPRSTATAAAKSLQSCPTLWDPIDGSPPGSPVPGILQARTLKWVAISFSKAWKWKVKVKFLSRVQLLTTPWTAAYQGPPSMGFSRQEYWSGVPLPPPGIYPEETKIERDTCIPLFFAALFTITRIWNQPRCPSKNEWIKKLRYIYTMEY